MKDRSSAPHHTPHATKAEVVEKILWLRQQYHFGPAKIAMYLQRYHDVKVSSSGVWRILKKVGLNRLPASQQAPLHPHGGGGRRHSGGGRRRFGSLGMVPDAVRPTGRPG
ncbi:helix-turn-helix domain-containing protein [Streptomyces sp. ISL-1]|nr:hypothetical protein [Streptomyces sp. ISL-1]MBT2392205.1 helix-turn-helix domain-containing protein [Streptomyces sp. ISL-1]